ncbi:MAG: tetraacyldisaccharide 4'-kinase [Bacteroidales bacterium]|nr:tetraacyldisaccharide 4'-kinase [Bacteroidales bacterium]
MEILRILLLPLSMIYGLITAFRNLLFDLKVLPVEKFDVPVISVGNLSAGGTGKTPHVEYLIRLLSEVFKVSTLSRGYGRKTSGFIAASDQDNAASIGDEPMQYHKKFNNIGVFVDEHRRRGIRNLLIADPATQVVLLDDAFQHRYVKPGLSILLTDYHKLYCNDYLMPSGTLREYNKGARRADIIIVTKSPRVLSPIDRRRIVTDLRPSTHQKVYFSYIRYGDIVSLWNKSCQRKSGEKYNTIVLFAGIANIYPLQDQLKRECIELIIYQFPDHHQYTSKDLDQIKRNFDDLYSRNKLLITTEKDAMRLLNPDLVGLASKMPVHYLPIEIDFHGNDKEAFNDQILTYVERNQ